MIGRRIKVLVVLLDLVVSLQLNGADRIRLNRRNVLLIQGLTGASVFHVKEGNAIVDKVRVLCKDEDFIRPMLDGRKYRVIELVENGVVAVLASEAACEEGACAVAIKVGNQKDPFPGLAHLTEHMLFLGTGESDDEWENFISSAGGNSNAFTEDEQTCYFFDVPAKRLTDSVLRFGKFFGDPRFSLESVDREISAVDSEHAKNLRSDGFRIQQVQALRFYPPYNNFGTGNRETLARSGIDDSLQNFFQAYYTGTNLAIAVSGAESLDTLQAKVQTAFSAVHPTKRLPVNENVALTSESILKESTPYLIESLAGQRLLTMSWLLPYSSYTAAPSERLFATRARAELYISHIVGHEGPRSLLAFFRKLGLVTGMAVGLGDDAATYRSFDLRIQLTALGLKQWSKISATCIEYMRILADVNWPDYCLLEPKALAELAFQWADLPLTSSLAVNLASNANHFARVDDPHTSAAEVLALGAKPLLYGDNVQALKKYAVQPVLEACATQKMLPLITVLAPAAELRPIVSGLKREVEPIYSTVFYRSTQKLADTYRIEKKDLFPLPNPFLPEGELRPRFQKAKAFTYKAPNFINDTFWTKQDMSFGVPRASAFAFYRTERCADTPKNLILARLYRSCLIDALRDNYPGFRSYDASLAGLDWGVAVGARGFLLTVAGYDQKLDLFAAETAKAVRAFTADFVARRIDSKLLFERARDTMSRELARDDVAPPASRAASELALILESPRHDIDEVRTALTGASLETLINWTQAVILNKLAAPPDTAFLAGNLETNPTPLANALFGSSMELTPSANTSAPRIRLVPLVQNTHDTVLFPTVLATPVSADAGMNKAVLASLQTGVGLQTKALTMGLASIADPLFYESLRTSQQLGYVVQCSARSREASNSIVFLVQSSRTDLDAQVLTQRIETFLKEDLASALNNEQNLQKYLDGLASNLLQRPQSFGEEVSRDWEEIVAGTFFWSRRQSLARAIRAITLPQLQKFYAETIIGPNRRPLLVQVDNFASLDTQEKDLLLPDDFKKASALLASAQSRPRLFLQRQLADDGAIRISLLKKNNNNDDNSPSSNYKSDYAKFVADLEIAPSIVEADKILV